VGGGCERGGQEFGGERDEESRRNPGSNAVAIYRGQGLRKRGLLRQRAQVVNNDDGVVSTGGLGAGGGDGGGRKGASGGAGAGGGGGGGGVVLLGLGVLLALQGFKGVAVSERCKGAGGGGRWTRRCSGTHCPQHKHTCYACCLGEGATPAGWVRAWEGRKVKGSGWGCKEGGVGQGEGRRGPENSAISTNLLAHAGGGGRLAGLLSPAAAPS